MSRSSAPFGGPGEGARAAEGLGFFTGGFFTGAFAAGARRRGFDIGPTIGASVVPIIVGNSPHAVMLSQRLLARGYNVVPAIFPGVPENQARLRFFITSEHTLEQIEGALDAVTEELAVLRNAPSLVSMVTQA